MSADNWGICPRCLATAKKEYEAKKEAARDAYGKIPADEWRAMEGEANKPFNEEPYRTLREDYEMYIVEDTAMFECNYQASCDKCGFEFEFDHKEQA